MKTSIYQGPGKFEIKEVPTPEPGEGEILMKVDYAAICGSDLHSYVKGLYIEPGQVMGHEFAGTVAAIGPNYPDKTLKVGQKIATNPFAACGKCEMCTRGKPNICKDALSLSLSYGKPGGFAEYVLLFKGAFVYKLPDNVSTLQAALVEPLSVAVHAVKKANLYFNDTCVVFGAGTIGNMIGQILKSIGAITVIQVDISQKRLDAAKKTGVDYIINAGEVNDVVAEIAKITGPGYYGPNGAGADIIFEAAAVPATIAQAIACIRHGGEIISIALPENNPTINLTAIVQKEIRFQGSFTYTDEFEEAIALLSGGKVVLDDIISDIFPLDEIGKAFDRQLDSQNSVKVVVKC